MKGIRRMISLWLALCLVISMVPVQTFAQEETVVETKVSEEPITTETEIHTVQDEAVGAEVTASGTCGENLTWTLVDGVLTVSGTGTMDSYEIACSPWYSYSDTIKTIAVENGVTSIGDSAFALCRNLTNVSIPDSVTSIGESAFSECRSLTDIILPDSLTEIGSYAFYCCNKLTKITLPKGITEIPDHAFWFCTELSDVTIPDGVTKIGRSAFSQCHNLTSIKIPAGVTEIDAEAFFATGLEHIVLPDSVTTLGNSAFNIQSLKSITLSENLTSITSCLLMGCEELTALEIPSNVEFIGMWAFYYCSSLGEITIPANVKEISHGAFRNCTALKMIKFLGDAPVFSAPNEHYTAIDHLEGVSATAYYPANNPTWTDDVMQNYGGTITWVPYEPEADEVVPDEVNLHDTLAELTDEDYLAFSVIAYREFETSGTVKDNLSGIWEEPWSESQDISYAELCKYIADWKLMALHELSAYNGFYAVAFTNDIGEVVIAYRGSIPPGHWFDDIVNSWDAYYDWILNDLPIELGNNLGPQFENALGIYNHLVPDDISKIRVTGHSLGGAWADAVSAYSGCQGITFNAVSVLDTLYKDEPEKMAQLFEGADRWNFVDHTNQYDILAGMFEKTFSTEMKPYKAHTSNIKIAESSIAAVVGAVGGFLAGGPIGAVAGCVGTGGLSISRCHSLDSFVRKDNEGDVKLTEVISSFTPTKTITNFMLTANHSVDFGTSIADSIRKELTILTPRTAYGGARNDVILSSTRADKLIGGKGADELDGNWGNDTYLYSWGDGTDIIHDISGNDTLKLLGVSSKADVHFVVDDTSDFVDVYYDDTLVAKVSRKNRASLGHSFTVEWDSVTSSLTAYLMQRNYTAHINIGCPVNIQILDSDETVVYTIKDGETGNFYTEYGNFYVYEEENGGYGKALDLIEGYTVQIVGVDAGTMDISYQKVQNGELLDPVEIADIPVTETYVAVLVEKKDGTVELEDNAVASVPMHRMYDPNSGEHFYTGSEVERDFLVDAGWSYEGVGFNFPEEGEPVYRLYEPTYGEHLYTMDQAEKEKLLSWGWNDEGVAFNSAGEDEVPQYRLHNPNAKRGGYHFTGSMEERDFLISIGWINEGIGWYSCLE